MKITTKTKADYIAEIGRMREKLEVYEVKDRQLRENLTQILRYYPNEGIYMNKPSVMTWLDIAFLMGEFRADANYSMLIQSREEMRREIETLKNPPKL